LHTNDKELAFKAKDITGRPRDQGLKDFNSDICHIQQHDLTDQIRPFIMPLTGDGQVELVLVVKCWSSQM